MEHTQIYPPLVTELLYETYNTTILTETLQRELGRQSKERRELLNCIDIAWNTKTLPIDLSGQSKVSDVVQIENAIALYTRLSDFIESDPAHRRIILYLPFELLPEHSFRSSSRRLNKVVKRFVETYLRAWRLLLESVDLRANFSNGDIVESEYEKGLSPLVVKAAHLIPVLVQKNLLTRTEVSELLKKTSNPVLIESITDSILVLDDIRPKGEKHTLQQHPYSACDIEVLFQHQSIALQEIDARFPENGALSARNKWERGDAIEKIMTSTAGLLLSGVKNADISIQDIVTLMNESRHPEIVIPAMLCIRKMCEDLQKCDTEMAHCYVEYVLPTMRVLYQKHATAIDECIEISLYHWCNLGVLNTTTMREFGLQPRNLMKSISTETVLSNNQKNQLEKLVQNIRTEPKLSQYLYPTAVLYGSKVKGYALSDTDTDIAFFIKPEVPISNRKKVQNVLSEILKSHGVQAAPLEVWLEKSNHTLHIRDMEDTDTYIARSSMVYVLLQSIWIGDTDTVCNLHKNLVTPYLTNEYRHSNSNREIWMREMERDMLQYRLLHKGYDRFYATRSPFISKHVGSIDGDSTFWDSGYRKLATRLFVSNVYIPLLK